MATLRVLVRGLFFVASGSTCASGMMTTAIGGWNEDAGSPLARLPIVTSREFLGKVSRPRPRATAALATLLLSLVLAVVH
jgi:hypothetical protein